MERISNKKFAAGQVLSDEKAQQVFGGMHIWTTTSSGHFDRWNDWDGDLEWTWGDTLTIYMISSPPPPPEGEIVVAVGYSEADLAARGVMIIHE